MKRDITECALTDEGPVRSRSNSTEPKRSRRSASVNLAESPIAWLHARGHLEDRLFAAGEKLRADFERAQLGARITMRWDPVRGGSAGDQNLTPGERQIAAKARFDGALEAAGTGLEDVLWRVVCAGESLPVAEKGLGWPARSGKLVLRLALERVADFYRIA